MKTQEEIVIQAKAYAESIGDKDSTSAYDYVMGYTQCQEDMADKKYTEEDLKLAFETGRNFQLTGEDNFNELLNSLNKQD